MITNKIDSYSLVGKSIKFVGIDKIFNSGNEGTIGDSAFSLLILDELSFDVCLEEVTKLFRPFLFFCTGYFSKIN